ncbi:MAG TPA: tRNA1(Val) (adenine(37)-N6)-methyltransferase [Bacilli bacterium]|nr:tRNA1(Val) (adenine(37)-N6)-methyltransferase [Bacilli bacterium]
MKNEVINDLLGYDGLKIIQVPDAFNFSLDSTLLAHFVSISKKTKQIIDLGCGNAPIPLFLTLRTTSPIIGVEIQSEIADLATRSVALNHLEHQIKIINQDLKHIYKQVGANRFDCVTCNPPFFPYKESSNTNKNEQLTIARHEVKATLDDFVNEAKKLLVDGGTLAMVHRADRLADCIEVFRKHHIEPKRLRFVYPKKTSSEALSILIEGKLNANNGGLKVLKPLYVFGKEDTYTKEILKIFNFPKP